MHSSSRVLHSQLRVVLHPGDEHVGSLEPESLQVLTYLKLSNSLPAVTTESACYSGTPILCDGQNTTIKTPYNIIVYLQEQGFDIDRHLSQRQHSEVMAYSSMLADRLMPALLYVRWLDTQNYLSVTRPSYGNLLSFPFSLFYLSSRHKSIKNLLMRGASFECTLEERGIELLGRAEECIALLAAKLGESRYFFGDRSSSLDALVYGYLEVIGQCPLPSNNSMQEKYQSCQNLVRFCRLIRRDCYPLVTERIFERTNVRQEESRNIWKDPAFWISIGAALLILGIQGIRTGLFSHLIKH